MTNYTKIKIGLVDTSAKDNSYPSMENKKDISIIDELKEGDLQKTDYATLENNYFVLNDSKTLIEVDTTGIALCSSEISDGNGNFSNYPVLKIYFSSLISTRGITLDFGNECYCNNLEMILKNESTQIAEFNITPSSTNVYIGSSTEEYKFNYIYLTFKSTNIPYRYLKIFSIEYGQILTFQKDNVISADLIEEIDLLSSELSINETNFEIYSEDDTFNMFNPDGVYSSLKSNQLIEISSIEDNNETFMGNFYLNSWESATDNVSKFSAIDLIGILDNIQYDSQYLTYNDSEATIQNAETIIDKIFSTAGFDSNYYEIDDELKNVKIKGIIFSGTTKEVLQKICFTIGALVDDSRSDKIYIRKPKTEVTSILTKEDYFQSSLKISKKDFVNTVNVYGYNYDGDQDNVAESTLYEASYEGDGASFFVKFDKPKKYTNLEYRNGNYYFYGTDILVYQTYTPFFIHFKLPETYEIINVEILGADLQENKEMYKYQVKESYEQEMAVTIDNCELIHTYSEIYDYISNVDVAKRFYEYYQNLFEIEFEFELDNEQVGDCIRIEVTYGQIVEGNLISLDIDVYTKIAKAKLVGKVI